MIITTIIAIIKEEYIIYLMKGVFHMNIQEAIQTRRSIPLVTDKAIPTELIEQVIEAATYAPNHYRTEPWRFFVLTGEGRVKLGNVFGEIMKSRQDDPQSEDSIKKIKRIQNNPLRSPVIIAVGVEPSDNNNVLLKEEYGAVSAAVQNMLLTAHAIGLGAIWRTGNICYNPKVSEFFGLSEQGEIAAFIYLGYPDMEPKPKKITHHKELSTWID